MRADRIFINADIATLDSRVPSASALAVTGDRFLGVGSKVDVLKTADQKTEIIDLSGKTVTPGFIETHAHISLYALTLLQIDCSSPPNCSIEDIKSRIKAQAQDTEPGQWIKGWGFDDTLIKDNRHLTRADLDECAPVNPVSIDHISGHLMYANSPALKIAGIGPETPSPTGGEIYKDEHGMPTGLLGEDAQTLVSGQMPPPDVAELKNAIAKAIQHFQTCGITSTHDGAIGYYREGIEVLKAYQALEEEGRLNLRVYLTLMDDLYLEILKSSLRPRLNSNFLRLGSVKLFQDGSIQALTAALTQPYYKDPKLKGDMIHSQDELDNLVDKHHQADRQLAIHANGDQAIESCLQALEKANKQYPSKDLRHMIIHCQMASPDHISRMKKLGVIPSYFINHIYYWGDRHRSIFLGPERSERLSLLNSSLKAGLTFTLHSDLPATPVAPIFAMHCAVNRITKNGRVLGASERIAPLSALRAYTEHAAYCSFEETIKGTISAGKLADFVILSANPFKTAPDKIKNIRVLETVLGGKTVYAVKDQRPPTELEV
jgi:predicted amidohydrolase YtcJ